MGIGIERIIQPAPSPSAPGHLISLPGGVEAPSAARRAVDEALGDVLTPERRHDTLVLVSEVVTNAVRHGGAGPSDEIAIEIRVAIDERHVTVEICDPGPGFDPPASPSAHDRGGFGLVLVESMSRSWGARARPGGGMCVWFEVEG